MTAQILELAERFGVDEKSTRPVPNARVTKKERVFLNKLKKKYHHELEGAKEMRIDLLNMTRGVPRAKVAEHLHEAEEFAPLLVLLFNDDQLVLLWALRDIQLEGDSNDKETSK
jgi:hypothetical protein